MANLVLKIWLYTSLLMGITSTNLTLNGYDQGTRRNLWLAEDIPNPRQNPEPCGRPYEIPSWICNPDGVLSAIEADRIDSVIQEFRRDTGTGRCRCKYTDECRRTPGVLTSHDNIGNVDNIYGGWQIGVAIVNQLNFEHYDTDRLSTKDILQKYGDYIRREIWRLGVCEDDLVIIVAVKQNLVYTAVGDQLKRTLPDHCVQQLQEENNHYFKGGHYADGIWGLISSYRDIMTGYMECKEKPKIAMYVTAAVFSVVILVGILFLRRRVRSGSCKVKDTCIGHLIGKSEHANVDQHENSLPQHLPRIAIQPFDGFFREEEISDHEEDALQKQNTDEKNHKVIPTNDST